jgi:hypothetical protein
MSLTKHLVRYAVIAGLVGGTAALVAGPDRLSALCTQARNSINGVLDKAIDDPIALRAQMKQLEGEYPERIAEVRGDLAELREQRSQLQRERAVSERVVTLADADMSQMQALIGKAQSAQSSFTLASDTGLRSPGSTPIVRVVFNGESMDMKEAHAKSIKIGQVKVAYASRLSEIDRDLGYLAQQESRLAQLSGQLETEHQEFQAQLWQMDRQVDSIARNERLIGMMEKRQETLDEQGRYNANSLEQLSSRFADIRAKQEAKLEVLGTSSNALNYEDRAKIDLDSRKAMNYNDVPGSTGQLAPLSSGPTIIEITPDTVIPSIPGIPGEPAAEAKPAVARPVTLR